MIIDKKIDFITSDEHYGHENIIKYCNRPFKNIDEMDETLIRNHNFVVSEKNIVYHIGDFTLKPKYKDMYQYFSKLNGIHYFIAGSHDIWIKDYYKNFSNIKSILIQDNIPDIENREFKFNDKKYYVTLCHYCMKSWKISHYNSIQLFGHHHGTLDQNDLGKQYDVGVDNNKFYPVNFKELIINIDKNFKNNFNYRGE